VTFLEDDGGYAIVASLKHEDVNSKVYNSESEWAYFECLQSQRGNICKHQIKVLMFLRPNLAKGKIAHYYGLLSGTLNGGLSSMFSPCPIFTPLNTKNKSSSLEDQKPCEKYL